MSPPLHRHPFALASVAALGSGLFLTPAQADTFGDGPNRFTMDFTTIGQPGNAADTTGSPNSAGGVAYEYRIGTYEVSVDMVDKANAAGGLGITLFDDTDLNKPARGVSWFEAALFVNWLNTSTGHSPAYQISTVADGMSYTVNPWSPGSSGYNPANPIRNQNAYYFIPSPDEWYKAAYYDPVTQRYHDYPTGSDSAPVAATGVTAPGTAVYGGVALANVNEAGGVSPFGTMGQGGNAWEWDEARTDGGFGVRGGSSSNSDQFLLSSKRHGHHPGSSLDIGFRVSSVPEPSAWPLMLVAPAAFCAWRRRKRYR